ncbi:MAG: TlpA disulfide reductase family protein [Chloroflexota bacterium]
MTDADIFQQLDEAQAVPPKRGLSLGSIVLLIGVALTVLVFGIALVRVQQGRPTSGPAPDFTLTTLDGQQFKLSDQKGKIVVINFWASWCGPCRTEAPALESLYQQYKDKDVTFIGITYADDPKDSQAFMAQYGMSYPVAEDGKSSVSKALYHIQGVPETFVIDKQGNINRFFYFLTDDSDASSDDLQVNQAELGKIIDGLLAQS